MVGLLAGQTIETAGARTWYALAASHVRRGDLFTKKFDFDRRKKTTTTTTMICEAEYINTETPVPQRSDPIRDRHSRHCLSVWRQTTALDASAAAAAAAAAARASRISPD